MGLLVINANFQLVLVFHLIHQLCVMAKVIAFQQTFAHVNLHIQARYAKLQFAMGLLQMKQIMLAMLMVLVHPQIIAFALRVTLMKDANPSAVMVLLQMKPEESVRVLENAMDQTIVIVILEGQDNLVKLIQ